MKRTTRTAQDTYRPLGRLNLDGAGLRRIRSRARAQPGEWATLRTAAGLDLAWRAGADAEELSLSRPGSVVFERELLAVLDALARHLGLAPAGRRVSGHAIVVSLAEGGR